MFQYFEGSRGLFEYSANLQIAVREFKHSASIEADMKKLQYDRVKNCKATNTCKPTRSWLTQ